MPEKKDYVKNIFGPSIMNTRELTWLKTEKNRKHVSQEELFQMVDDYIEEA